MDLTTVENRIPDIRIERDRDDELTIQTPSQPISFHVAIEI